MRLVKIVLALIHALTAHAHAHPHVKPKPEPIPAVWQRVAECESSGNWQDTSGIFDGGVQFLPSTWVSFKGTQFAPTADRATPWQQIIVARRVLRRQGVMAWPHCGPLAGLTVGS